jgi:hypothetical protein
MKTPCFFNHWAKRFHTVKSLRIWDWCSIMHFPERIKWTLSADGYILRWEDSEALHHTHLWELGGSYSYHWQFHYFFIAMWSIPNFSGICVRYVYGVWRRDHISDYASFLLGMPLGKFFSFRICCLMYNISSSEEPGYLHGPIQFVRLRRLGGIIIPRHNYAATAASLFFGGAI